MFQKHFSGIRRLQSILLKVALMLGVRVHAPVKFVGLNEPTEREKGVWHKQLQWEAKISFEMRPWDFSIQWMYQTTGWTANLEPADSPASKYEFDFIVGAEGKKISLQGFRKRCFRAKQALAITYNLINENRREDTQVWRKLFFGFPNHQLCVTPIRQLSLLVHVLMTNKRDNFTAQQFGVLTRNRLFMQVEEMGGWTFQSNQNFFKKLRDQAGVELENIVYFRDETHYFVMTTKKLNLLSRGVLKEVSLPQNYAQRSCQNTLNKIQRISRIPCSYLRIKNSCLCDNRTSAILNRCYPGTTSTGKSCCDMRAMSRKSQQTAKCQKDPLPWTTRIKKMSRSLTSPPCINASIPPWSEKGSGAPWRWQL